MKRLLIAQALATVVGISTSAAAPIEPCSPTPPADLLQKFPQLALETRLIHGDAIVAAGPSPSHLLAVSMWTAKPISTIAYENAVLQARSTVFAGALLSRSVGSLRNPRLERVIGDGDVSDNLRQFTNITNPNGANGVDTFLRNQLPSNSPNACSKTDESAMWTAIAATGYHENYFWQYFEDRAATILALSLNADAITKFDIAVAKAEALLNNCFEPATNSPNFAAPSSNLSKALGALSIDKAPPYCTGLRVASDYLLTARHCAISPTTGAPVFNTGSQKLVFTTFEGKQFEVCAIVGPTGNQFDSPGPQDSILLRVAPDALGSARMKLAPTADLVSFAQGVRATGVPKPQLLDEFGVFPGAHKHFQGAGATSPFVRSKQEPCFLVTVSGGVAYNGCNIMHRASGGPTFVVPPNAGAMPMLLGVNGGTFESNPDFDATLSPTLFPINAVAVVPPSLLPFIQ